MTIKTVLAAFGVLILAMAAGTVAMVASMAGREPTVLPVATIENAKGICRAFVERRLRAPSTASFVPGSSVATQVDSITFRVRGQFDAQNGFGATLRGAYACRVRYHRDGDRWEALDIQVR
jgi:hypothetical protein